MSGSGSAGSGFGGGRGLQNGVVLFAMLTPQSWQNIAR